MKKRGEMREGKEEKRGKMRKLKKRKESGKNQEPVIGEVALSCVV
jgi:hypothetical protein